MRSTNLTKKHPRTTATTYTLQRIAVLTSFYCVIHCIVFSLCASLFIVMLLNDVCFVLHVTPLYPTFLFFSLFAVCTKCIN